MAPDEGPSVLVRRAAAGTAGCALFLFLRGGLGPALAAGVGLAVAVLADRFLAKLEPASVQRRRELRADQLPMALELIAAAVAAGSPTVAALELVSTAVDRPLAEDLATVAAHLRLGAEPEAAWRDLLDPDRAGPAVAAAARAVLRAERTGARLAPALNRIAADARADAAARAVENAHRAGVASAAPLGLCFLPAFIVLGVVPIVVSGLTHLF